MTREPDSEPAYNPLGNVLSDARLAGDIVATVLYYNCPTMDEFDQWASKAIEVVRARVDEQRRRGRLDRESE